jgi:hypothetical protein
MKRLKMLGLAMVVAASLASFAGSASANPVLTSPEKVEYTGNITATAEGTLLLQAGFANITCTTSTVGGPVTTNSTTKASGPITTLDFSGCNATVTTLANGSLEVVSAGEGKGTVRGSGTQVTVSTLGVSCVYGTTTNTPLGTLTGGTPAKIEIKATFSKISGGFLCADPASWSGSYTVTSPGTLLVDGEAPPPPPSPLTSPANTEYAGEITATASSSLLLQAGFANITCTESTVKGSIEASTATSASGKIGTLTFANCNSTVDVLANGSLEVVSAGGGKGTVKGYGTQVTVSTLGVSCVYGTGTKTTLGTLTGGTPATMNIKASLPKISGGFLCASPASWSGSYTVTSPGTLLVDGEAPPPPPPPPPSPLTSPANTEYTGEINATASSSLLLEMGFQSVTCTASSAKGKVESHTATTAGGKISSLSFSACGGTTVDVITNGSLSISSNGDGTGAVSGSGTQVTISILGTSCVYGTTGTLLGTLTGGTPATMKIKASLPKISGGFSCASPAFWSGSYTVTSPSTLLID